MVAPPKKKTALPPSRGPAPLQRRERTQRLKGQSADLVQQRRRPNVLRVVGLGANGQLGLGTLRHDNVRAEETSNVAVTVEVLWAGTTVVDDGTTSSEDFLRLSEFTWQDGFAVWAGDRPQASSDTVTVSRAAASIARAIMKAAS